MATKRDAVIDPEMADPKAGRPPILLDRAGVADLLGVSTRTVSRLREELLPEAVSGSGNAVRFDAAAVVALWVELKVAEAEASAPGDSMLAGGDSPALERYRLARAQLAERDLAERDQVLVRREAMFESLKRGALALRSAGENLTRRFGNDAGIIYNEAVDEFDAAMHRTFGD